MWSLWWRGASVVVAAVAVAACGGDGPAPVTGVAALASARVCLDLDGDLACTDDEPASTTQSDGGFRLEPTRTARHRFVVVEAEPGVTRATDHRVVSTPLTFAAPPSADDVSVWTTLAVGLVEAGRAQDFDAASSRVAAAFALDRADTGASVSGGSVGLRQTTAVLEDAFRGVAAKHLAEAPPKRAIARAAAELYDEAETLLAVAEQQRIFGDEPPPENTSVTASEGIFYGDFEAIPINTNMSYGVGLDASNYALKGEPCVDVGDGPFLGLCENTFAYTFELVESVNELTTTMRIGASAKAGVSVAGFDVVSVSGEFEFLRDTSFKHDTLYVYFREERRLCGYRVAPTLKPAYELLFTSDYPSFRSACGDRYLSSVVSGGHFTGLLEITVDDNTKREQLRLELSGKVMGIEVFDEEWVDTIESIARAHSARVTVLSSASEGQRTFNADYSGLEREYAAYLARVSSPDCFGGGDLRACGYLATFAPYETVSASPPGNATNTKRRLSHMTQVEDYYFDVAAVVSALDQVLLAPDEYNIGDDVDAYNAPNDWSLVSLEEWRATMVDYQSSAVDAWTACYNDLDACTQGPSELGLPGRIDLVRRLPTRKFLLPEDCAALAEQFRVTADGQRTLFFNRDFRQRYRAVCVGMATSTPKTYLLLGNTSANGDAPSYNYSLHVDEAQGTLARTFDALQVRPVFDATGAKVLRVVYGQDGYAAMAEVVPFAASTDTAALSRSLHMLTASVAATGTASANLNLEGTPFALDGTVEFLGQPSCSSFVTTISPDRKNVDLTIEAPPACRVSSPDLRLQWDGG